jgi:hypothetical protein
MKDWLISLLAAITLVAFVVWCAKETLPLIRALL